MKNQRRLIPGKGNRRPMIIKSQEALNYADAFVASIPAKYRLNYEGPVSLRCRVWYPSRRQDLDIEYLKDLLQKAGVIKNDRQVQHQEAWRAIDKDRPRIHFTLYPLREDDDARNRM